MTTHVEQVGGHHYQSRLQHWDLCDEYDVDYLAGNATAYICRHDRKGTPRQDLEKARSYLLKSLAEGHGCRRLVPERALDSFNVINHMSGEQSLLLWRILVLGTPQDYRMAIDALEGMLNALPT